MILHSLIVYTYDIFLSGYQSAIQANTLYILDLIRIPRLKLLSKNKVIEILVIASSKSQICR